MMSKGDEYMNINKNLLKWSTILSLLSAYVLPGRPSGEHAFTYGYPLGFFKIHENALNSGDTILMSTALDLFILGLDILIIYIIISVIGKLISSKKNNFSS